MKTITYTIPNISCMHCVHTIKSEVRDLAGVLTVEGDFNSKVVSITFEDPATAEKIETALAEIDYPPAK
jgi:copper chaperone CopZ